MAHGSDLSTIHTVSATDRPFPSSQYLYIKPRFTMTRTSQTEEYAHIEQQLKEQSLLSGLP